MKQTTLQFEKKVKQPLTLERLQAAIDLISKTNNATKSLRQVGLSGSYIQYLVKARILVRINGHKVEVIKPVLERKDFYRVKDIQTKHLQKYYSRKTELTNYTKADTDMLGLVNMPQTEPIKLQRTPKPRVKNAIALPWWKRFLLYLLNH
jgi:hypothetical protein